MTTNSVIPNPSPPVASAGQTRLNSSNGNVSTSMEASMSMLLMKMMESNKLMRNLAQKLAQQQRQSSINILGASQDKKIMAAAENKKAGIITGSFAIAGGVVGASPLASKTVKAGWDQVLPSPTKALLHEGETDRIKNIVATTPVAKTATGEKEKEIEATKQKIYELLDQHNETGLITKEQIKELTDLLDTVKEQNFKGQNIVTSVAKITNGYLGSQSGFLESGINHAISKVNSHLPKDRSTAAQNMGRGHYLATGGGPLLNAVGQLMATDSTLQADMARSKGELIKSNQDVYDRDRLQTEERSREFSRQSLNAIKSLTDLYVGLTSAFTLK